MTGGRTKAVPRGRTVVYLSRAENLLRTVDWALRESNADGAATNAIHAAIALGDAYTVHFLGERSRGQDHHEVFALVSRCRAPKSRDVQSACSSN